MDHQPWNLEAAVHLCAWLSLSLNKNAQLPRVPEATFRISLSNLLQDSILRKGFPVFFVKHCVHCGLMQVITQDLYYLWCWTNWQPFFNLAKCKSQVIFDCHLWHSNFQKLFFSLDWTLATGYRGHTKLWRNTTETLECADLWFQQVQEVGTSGSGTGIQKQEGPKPRIGSTGKE